MTGMLAFCWLGERLNCFQIVMMLFSFGGITLVTLSRDKATVSGTLSEFSAYHAGVALCIALIFVFALAAVTTRKMKGLHFSVIQFYIALCGFVASAIWVLILLTHKDVFAFSGYVPWLELVGGSVCHWMNQTLVTCMNQSLNPATVGIFLYVQVVYAILFDYVAFHTSLQTMQWIGAAIIVVFSCLAAIERKRSADKKKAQEALAAQNKT